MNIPLARPARLLARYFSQQKVTFRGIPARKIKFCTSEAYICMKTKGAETICPEISGHFRQFGRQLSDILATASAKQRSDFLIGGADDRNKRCAAKPVWAVTVISPMRSRSSESAKETSHAEAPRRKARLAPVGGGGAESTPTTGYPEKLLKMHGGRAVASVKIQPVSGAVLIWGVTYMSQPVSHHPTHAPVILNPLFRVKDPFHCT